MNVLPVITRELRAQSRQPFTYAGRLLAVAVLMLGGSWFISTHALALNLNQNMGYELFRFLHLTLLLSISVLVPLSAADSISREKREGTLGLLFLTQLRPAGIVTAKVFASGIRAFSLLFAVAPVFSVPILLGGVTREQVAVSLLVNATVMAIAMGASIIVSSLTRSQSRAMTASIALTFGLMWLMAVFCGLAMMWQLGGTTIGAPPVTARPLPGQVVFTPPPPSAPSFLDNLAESSITEIAKVGGSVAGVEVMRPWRLSRIARGGSAQTYVLRTFMASAALAGIFVAASVVVAAWWMNRSWKAGAPPRWASWVTRRFFTPRFALDRYRAWLRGMLDRNPVGWLERRAWHGRIISWVWFGLVIVLFSYVLTDPGEFRMSRWNMEDGLAWLLVFSLAAGAAGSFRRERESGVMELLLVSPMTTGQIVWGRMRALWGCFAVAVMTFVVLSLINEATLPNFRRNTSVTNVLIHLLTIPVIGLYFSLRNRGIVPAFLNTLLFAVVVPQFMLMGWWIIWMNLNDSFPDAWVWHGSTVFVVCISKLFLAAFFYWRLRMRLERRSFPFQR